MSEQLSPQEELRHHSFDGIQEYDNPLPTWWLFLFWATIFASAFYVVYYHFGHGESVEGQYDRTMLVVSDMQMKEILKLGPITNQTINGLKTDQSKMLAAQALFVGKCGPCHGNRAEGNIGPNLTDDFWLHGALPTQIYRTIMEGVPAKGMLSWKTQLPVGQILTLSAYVDSLKGSAPPNPKAPQGDRFDPAQREALEARTDAEIVANAPRLGADGQPLPAPAKGAAPASPAPPAATTPPAGASPTP